MPVRFEQPTPGPMEEDVKMESVEDVASHKDLHNIQSDDLVIGPLRQYNSLLPLMPASLFDFTNAYMGSNKKNALDVNERSDCVALGARLLYTNCIQAIQEMSDELVLDFTLDADFEDGVSIFPRPTDEAEFRWGVEESRKYTQLTPEGRRFVKSAMKAMYTLVHEDVIRFLDDRAWIRRNPRDSDGIIGMPYNSFGAPVNPSITGNKSTIIGTVEFFPYHSAEARKTAAVMERFVIEQWLRLRLQGFIDRADAVEIIVRDNLADMMAKRIERTISEARAERIQTMRHADGLAISTAPTAGPSGFRPAPPTEHARTPLRLNPSKANSAFSPVGTEALWVDTGKAQEAAGAGSSKNGTAFRTSVPSRNGPKPPRREVSFRHVHPHASAVPKPPATSPTMPQTPMNPTIPNPFIHPPVVRPRTRQGRRVVRAYQYAASELAASPTATGPASFAGLNPSRNANIGRLHTRKQSREQRQLVLEDDGWIRAAEDAGRVDGSSKKQYWRAQGLTEPHIRRLYNRCSSLKREVESELTEGVAGISIGNQGGQGVANAMGAPRPAQAVLPRRVQFEEAVSFDDGEDRAMDMEIL